MVSTRKIIHLCRLLDRPVVLPQMREHFRFVVTITVTVTVLCLLRNTRQGHSYAAVAGLWYRILLAAGQSHPRASNESHYLLLLSLSLAWALHLLLLPPC